MIRKDQSVDLDQLRPEIRQAIEKLDEWHKEVTGRDLVITSGAEWIKHKVARSAHYRGDAIDFRVWYLDDLDKAAARVRAILGPDFVVINEQTHIHVHWSPIWK